MACPQRFRVDRERIASVIQRPPDDGAGGFGSNFEKSLVAKDSAALAARDFADKPALFQLGEGAVDGWPC